MATPDQRSTVFISYSHKDSQWLKHLRTHLDLLDSDELIDYWDDTRIEPGSKWRKEIEKALASARVAILLVSAEFMASKFIKKYELPTLLQAAERDGLLILPLLVSPSRFSRTPPLKDIQAVNSSATTLIQLEEYEQEAIFDQLAERVGNALINPTLQCPTDEAIAMPLGNARPTTTPTPTNPFVPLAGRIGDGGFFFDRVRERREVFELLNSDCSVALIGPCEIGKSSLAHAIHRHAERELTEARRSIYIDLQQIVDEDDFYAALCDQAEIPLSRGYALTRALKDKRLLLILDEMEKMSWDGFSRGLHGQLRGLAEGPNAPLRLLLAARRPLDQVFSNSEQPNDTSPLSNICQQVDLHPWDLETTTAFIETGLADTGVHFEAAHIARLIDQSDGHPKRLMNACFRLFNDTVQGR